MPATDQHAAYLGRPCPEWFASPQLGVFIHWGIFAVPAWAPRGRSIHDLMIEDYDNATALQPYAEWYANAMTIPGSPTATHHARTWGRAPYEDFRPLFDEASQAFDAEAWADLFVAAGARYVVFVTKHHDGYCLWPTKVRNPHRPGWHSSRDFVGELAAAVRARGLRFGVYYSGGLDWTFHHEPIRNLGDMLACVPTGEDYRAYAQAQLRELIERYEPSVLWNDIAWPDKRDTPELFAAYYAAVPDGVVNDRWFGERALFQSLRNEDARAAFNARMKAAIIASNGRLAGGAPPHCDFRTVEYGLGEIPADKKWEACRGIGLAFGYNSNEIDADHLDHAGFTRLRDDVLSQRGNLLINVGPMADGRLPDVQRAALTGA
jgi:alpha-L-fucosidase